MKTLLLVAVMMFGMNLSSKAEENLVGEFLPVEIIDLPMRVIAAVEEVYPDAELCLAAVEEEADGSEVYQLTIRDEENGIMQNVYFTDSGEELK